jgi:hypothetical protein
MNSNSSVGLTRKVTITSSAPVTREQFIKKIEESAEGIINFLKKNGCTKLGHIGLISTTDGEDYLELCISDIKQKPQIKGVLRKNFEKIKLTFNIIEFGISREDIEKKINEEIKDIQEYFAA